MWTLIRGRAGLFPRRRGPGVQAQRADPGVMPLQVFPEQQAQRAGHVLQGHVVNVDGAVGQVIDQQVADRPAGDLMPVDELGRAALPDHHDRLQPGRGARPEHAGLGEQRVIQVPAVLASALVLAEAVLQLHAVSDRDVLDEPALADHDPGDPVERLRPVGHAAAAGGLAVGLQRREAAGVGNPAELREQAGWSQAQQPPVVRPDDLPADEGGHAAGQVGVVVVPGAAPGPEPVQRDPHPGGSGLFGAAGQPPFLPGAAGLVLEPVQQLDQPAFTGLEVGGAVRGERQAPGPLENSLARRAGLPPDQVGPAGL
jgi:hypothetical protein